MRKYFVLLMLAIVPALAMAQTEMTNKGAHYLEIKTGLAISDAPSSASLVKGISFDTRYAYGLINNLDVVAAFTSYNGYELEKSYDLNSRVDRMYCCNALQIGVRGKVKCFDFMNLKLSLTGGLANHAQTKFSYPTEGYPPYPYTDMYLSPCFGGMFEVDFDITKRMSLGLFFGRTMPLSSKNAFDNTGLSMSVRL